MPKIHGVTDKHVVGWGVPLSVLVDEAVDNVFQDSPNEVKVGRGALAERGESRTGAIGGDFIFTGLPMI